MSKNATKLRKANKFPALDTPYLGVVTGRVSSAEADSSFVTRLHAQVRAAKDALYKEQKCREQAELRNERLYAEIIDGAYLVKANLWTGGIVGFVCGAGVAALALGFA